MTSIGLHLRAEFWEFKKMQLIEAISKLSERYLVGDTLRKIYNGASTILNGMQPLIPQPALAGIGSGVYLTNADGGIDGKVSNPVNGIGSDIADTISPNKPEQRERNFEERARDFLIDLKNGKGFREIYRDFGFDVSGLKVGIGEHAGLVFKNGQVYHAQRASEFYDELMKHFKERSYEPWSYELVKPNFIAVGEQVGIIQDYFPQPSLSELMRYFFMIKEIKKMERKLQRGLNTEEMETFRGKFVGDKDSGLRCKQFLDEQPNKSITLEDITDFNKEFRDDTDYLHLDIKPSNVIVLGQRKTRDLEKMGLAIIDY